MRVYLITFFEEFARMVAWCINALAEFQLTRLEPIPLSGLSRWWQVVGGITERLDARYPSDKRDPPAPGSNDTAAPAIRSLYYIEGFVLVTLFQSLVQGPGDFQYRLISGEDFAAWNSVI